MCVGLLPPGFPRKNPNLGGGAEAPLRAGGGHGDLPALSMQYGVGPWGPILKPLTGRLRTVQSAGSVRPRRPPPLHSPPGPFDRPQPGTALPGPGPTQADVAAAAVGRQGRPWEAGSQRLSARAGGHSGNCRQGRRSATLLPQPGLQSRKEWQLRGVLRTSPSKRNEKQAVLFSDTLGKELAPGVQRSCRLTFRLISNGMKVMTSPGHVLRQLASAWTPKQVATFSKELSSTNTKQNPCTFGSQFISRIAC